MKTPIAERAGLSFSFRRLALITENTFRESVRQRLLSALLLVAGGLIGSIWILREFSFGISELKFISDVGFGALVFFGSVLTIFCAAQQFFDEVDRRTLLTLLAKPVLRSEFILGKLVGVWLVVGVFCSLTTALIALILVVRETSLLRNYPETFGSVRTTDYAGVLASGILHWVKFGVLAAITLFVSSYARSQMFAVVVSSVILVICHLRHLANELSSGMSGFAHVSFAVGSLTVPDFQIFDLGERLASASPVTCALFLSVILYGALYLTAFAGLAIFSFNRREF